MDALSFPQLSDECFVRQLRTLECHARFLVSEATEILLPQLGMLANLLVAGTVLPGGHCSGVITFGSNVVSHSPRPGNITREDAQ